eukprot:CAMPEP_0181443874 /NCGR_PEP_ID=MMETSP1110-20121109/24776_1 /TAXON_ID=174948 /ORGANISM="Symbiodinium sp., Strain CCMP421" /LENGTH=624 /DNA_ID=CAMNT_0023567859 /DNA_START=22 /DNA_END=1893 /DNA_ORIENTATION=+
MARLPLLLGVLGHCLAETAPFQCAEGQACEPDRAELLQRRGRKRRENVPTGLHKVDGKSVYLLMPDRFAREGGLSDGDDSACSGSIWCNGTLKGITAHLDYIQDLGVDCIWVTPVPVNFYGPDGDSGYGYHGYWAQDWFKIEPNFGTAEDMKELVRATHERGMCYIQDIVLNHVRPLHSSQDLAKVKPFNETSYFHLLNISNQTFDEYTYKMGGWPYPTQAIGAGAQCSLQFFPDGTPDGTNNGTYCNNYPGNNFSKENYFGDRAHGPPYLKYCSIGNYVCEGYDERVSEQGWFYDLGDLNQSVDFVRQTLKDWVSFMVDEYKFDAIRLDTTPYMPKQFLQEVQDMLFELDNPLVILGEVTASNISFHASYQWQDGHRVLGGMENFPLFYTAVPGYCGWPNGLLSPVTQFDLTYLSDFTNKQQKSGLYTNTDLLMNMMDNQDDTPLFSLYHNLDETGGCIDDKSRQVNSLAWLMLAKGMPVITWGTEQGNTVYRNSLWQYNWTRETSQFKLYVNFNQVRKAHNVATAPMSVVEQLLPHAKKDRFVFRRGPRLGKDSVWVFTNNRPASMSTEVHYYVHLPKPPQGFKWYDTVGGQPFRRGSVRVTTWSTYPLVLVLKRFGPGDAE